MGAVEEYVTKANEELEREGLAGRVSASHAIKSVMLTVPYRRWAWTGDAGELPALLDEAVRWARAQASCNPLKRYMLGRNLSTRKAAKIFGVSHHRIFELMQEEANPSIEVRARIERQSNGEIGRDTWANPIPGTAGRPPDRRPVAYVKGR